MRDSWDIEKENTKAIHDYSRKIALKNGNGIAMQSFEAVVRDVLAINVHYSEQNICSLHTAY